LRYLIKQDSNVLDRRVSASDRDSTQFDVLDTDHQHPTGCGVSRHLARGLDEHVHLLTNMKVLSVRADDVNNL
jgi:hypothetical protein